MMIFIIIALSCLIFILLFLLICISLNYTKKNNELIKKDSELFTQKVLIDHLRTELLTSKKSSYSNSNVNKEIKEAVFYAVKKSHPDNGGNSDDFIKFKKIYDLIK